MSRASAFSILELLVVITILAGLVALTMPALQRTYNTVVFNTEKKDVFHQISQLSYKAYSLSKTIEGVQALQFLNLPEDWKVADFTQLRITSSGYCMPAVIEFEVKQVIRAVEVLEPFCDVKELEI